MILIRSKNSFITWLENLFKKLKTNFYLLKEKIKKIKKNKNNKKILIFISISFFIFFILSGVFFPKLVHAKSRSVTMEMLRGVKDDTPPFRAFKNGIQVYPPLPVRKRNWRPRVYPHMVEILKMMMNFVDFDVINYKSKGINLENLIVRGLPIYLPQYPGLPLYRRLN